MIPLSYAQRLEDLHIALAFAGEAPGTYVDVGGGHPVADNVTLALYLAGWRGLVVEPQQDLARLTAALRPRDAVACTLAGRAEGRARFHRVADTHGFSTMVEAQAATVRAQGASVAVEEREVTTLAALVRAHGVTRIDLLKIDVEGAEADVLAGHDWALRPRLVVIEAVAPGSMASTAHLYEPDLLARGYRLGLDDGLNRFYVAEEEAGLRARLPDTPRPWDSAPHLWDLGRADAAAGHPDHRLARALLAGFLARLPLLPAKLLTDLAAAGGLAFDPASDAGRAALGRIACRHDGGFMGEGAADPVAPS